MKYCSFLLCCCYPSEPSKKTTNALPITDGTRPLDPAFQYHHNWNCAVATKGERSISAPPAKSEMHRSYQALKTRAASTSPVLIPTFQQNIEGNFSSYGTNGTLQFKMSFNNLDLTHSKNTMSTTPQTKTAHPVRTAPMETKRNTLKISTVKLCQKNRFSFSQYMREKERKKQERATIEPPCHENNIHSSDSFSGVFPMSLSSN